MKVIEVNLQDHTQQSQLNRHLPKKLSSTWDSHPKCATDSRRCAKMSGSRMSTPTGPAPKKLGRRTLHTSGEKSIDRDISTQGDGSPFSPEALALMLDEHCKELISSNEKLREVEPDLADFDLGKDAESPSKFLKEREEISKMAGKGQFDVSGRTALNYANVSIAGAKLIVDEKRATRSVTKKLSEQTGVDENRFLYPPIPECHGHRRDYKWASSIASIRRSSVIESFVDFQKQIKFKRSVLKHVAEQQSELAKSHPRMTRRRTQQEQQLSLTNPKKRRITRTPKKKGAVNPLSDKKILDDYAAIVASEVTENRSTGVRGRLAPIPLDLDL
uniref:Uncharacterized protein n=1 Tax=Steinernema glaseri TaxID=37863 RepID=A0A1I7YNF9_9BILA